MYLRCQLLRSGVCVASANCCVTCGRVVVATMCVHVWCVAADHVCACVCAWLLARVDAIPMRCRAIHSLGANGDPDVFQPYDEVDTSNAIYSVSREGLNNLLVSIRHICISTHHAVP